MACLLAACMMRDFTSIKYKDWHQCKQITSESGYVLGHNFLLRIHDNPRVSRYSPALFRHRSHLHFKTRWDGFSNIISPCKQHQAQGRCLNTACEIFRQERGRIIRSIVEAASRVKDPRPVADNFTPGERDSRNFPMKCARRSCKRVVGRKHLLWIWVVMHHSLTIYLLIIVELGGA